jgi:hypothetical protein
MKTRYICATIIILFSMAAFLRYRNDSQNKTLSPVALNKTQSTKVTSQTPTGSITVRSKTENAAPEKFNHGLEKDVWINQAIEGFNLIENMMPEFEVNGNNERLMLALQRILLEDDLKFALRKRGYTDSIDTASAYKALVEGKNISQSLPNLKSGKETSEKNQTRTLNSDKRSKYITNLKKVDDPFSRQLSPVFEKFNELEIDPNVHIELFKDVICYLSLESFAHESFEILLVDIGEVADFRKTYEKELEAIRKVYAFRFEQLHGYDPDLIFNEFKNITLSNINIHPLREYE